MKKIMMILLYMIFGYSLGQNSAQLVTAQDIDKQLETAKTISINNPKKSIQLSENIYHLSKSINYRKGILESSTLLMIQYYDSGNFKKVIDLSKEEEELAIALKDDETLSNIHMLRGLSYTALGFNDESLKELERSLEISEKITSENSKNYQKALAYNGLAAYSAHINTPVDSVIHYQKKSLETINKMDDSKEYIDKKYYMLAQTYINLGKSSSAMQHFIDAGTFFSKALEICQNKKYKVNKVLEVAILNEFAWLYHDQKKYDNAILYAQQAERMEKSVSSPYIRRDIYEVFFKSYIEQGNKEEISKKYMDLYTKLNDSLVNYEKKIINTPAKYIAEKQEKTYRSNIHTILLISIAVVILFLIFGLLYLKKNKQRSDKKYGTIIDELKSQKDNNLKSEVIVDKTSGMTDDTVNTILLKLQKFEISQKFLRKDINLAYLSNAVNTNTKYLSEIIKQHKGKSFSNYINGLRIQYIIEVLYKDPQYREYKISYLAETCGFASREVFAISFKKETGFTPSYFINKLRLEKEF